MHREEADMITLTEEQRHELTGPTPLVLDPDTQQVYVLVRQDLYQRLQTLIEPEGLDMREVGLLVERAMREDDADDPSLAFYQQKYGKRP
jgi:hypothetical protein